MADHVHQATLLIDKHGDAVTAVRALVEELANRLKAAPKPMEPPKDLPPPEDLPTDLDELVQIISQLLDLIERVPPMTDTLEEAIALGKAALGDDDSNDDDDDSSST